MRRMTNPNPKWGKSARKPLLQGSAGRYGGPPLLARMPAGQGQPSPLGNQAGGPGTESQGRAQPAGAEVALSQLGEGQPGYRPQRQGCFCSD